MKQTKQFIRQNILRQRKQLSQQQQQYRSQQIANHLRQSTCFIHAKHIAYYLPVSGEADPTSLQLLTNTPEDSTKKTFYLPIVVQQGGNNLLFASTNKNTHYKKNKYAIKEPVYHAHDLQPANKLDLVITPLVGFDRQGNRLGMGGGYYDRTFAFKHRNNAGRQQKTPLLIGYAYNFQQIKKLPAEQWDIPLDGIVTESGMLIIK